jgi:hypothetical protein
MPAYEKMNDMNAAGAFAQHAVGTGVFAGLSAAIVLLALVFQEV